MLGDVAPEDLVTPDGLRPGDAIVLSKGIAIEGTAILARERGTELEGLVPPDVLERAAAFLHDPGISVVPAARPKFTRPERRSTDTVSAFAANFVRVFVSETDTSTERGLATTLRLCAGTTLAPAGRFTILTSFSVKNCTATCAAPQSVLKAECLTASNVLRPPAVGAEVGSIGM